MHFTGSLGISLVIQYNAQYYETCYKLNCSRDAF